MGFPHRFLEWWTVDGRFADGLPNLKLYSPVIVCEAANPHVYQLNF